MNRFIHRGFFTEVFRQLKTPGIVMACVLMLFNVGTFFTNVTAMVTSQMSNVPSDSTNAVYMMLFIYVSSLVLTFIAFNWLNRRSTSDFYHALPIKRAKMYWSAFLAVVLWIVIAITGYAVVHAFLYLITGMPFNYLSYLCVYLNMLIGIIQVAGVVSLACALSGTRFVNLFSTAVMLLIPRALLLVLAGFIQEEASFLPVLRISFLFDPSFNIFGTPYMTLFGGAADLAIVSFTNPIAMAYSLVHACLIAFLGMLAFRHRPSEAAGMPMRNKIIQGIIRTAFGLPLLLIAVLLLLTDNFSISAAVILTLFAFTFYCLYELISTKSAKRMLRSMPLFSICIGIAVLYLFIPKLIAKASASIQIEADAIQSIEVLDDSELTDFGLQSMTYERICARSIQLSDPNVLKTVERAYRRTVNQNSADSTRTITVRIHREKGVSLLRTLHFTTAEYETMMRARATDTQYVAAISQFPKGVHYFDAPGLTAAESREIGELLAAEYSDLKQNIHVMTKEDTPPSKIYYRIKLCGVFGVDSYYEYYEITDLTSKTAQRYTELLYTKYNESTKDAIRQSLKWLNDGADFPLNMYLGSIAVIDAEAAYYNIGNKVDRELNPIPKYEIPEYVEIFEMLLNAEPTDNAAEGVTIRMQGGYQRNMVTLFDDTYSEQVYLTVKLTDEQIARIQAIVDQYSFKYYDDSPYAFEFDL